MKISSETIENRQVVLEVEAAEEEIEESLNEAHRHLAKKVNVPGFRKGKASREMLERYIGRGAMLEEAVEHLVPKLLSQAIEEQKLEVIARPQIEITNIEPITFKATVALPPVVELGNFREISIDKEKVEVPEEEVDKVVEKVRVQNATWEPVERPVAFSDLISIDIYGSSGDEQLIDQEDIQMQVVKDMPVPVPGFPEQLEGLEKDQEKEFSISVPEDFGVEKVAGRECNFKVKVKEIKEQKLPDIDDDFAKSIGGDFDSMETMRNNIVSNLFNVYQSGAMKRYEQQVLDAVVGMSKIEYPPVLVEEEIDRVIEEQERELAMRKMTLEDYLESQKRSVEELRDSLRPLADKQVQIALAVGKVIEQEKIEAEDAEIDEEIDRMAMSVGERGEELKKAFDSPAARRAIARNIAAVKAVKLLMDIASGEEQTAPETTEEASAESQEPGAEAKIEETPVDVAVSSGETAAVQEQGESATVDGEPR